MIMAVALIMFCPVIVAVVGHYGGGLARRVSVCTHAIRNLPCPKSPPCSAVVELPTFLPLYVCVAFLASHPAVGVSRRGGDRRAQG